MELERQEGFIRITADEVRHNLVEIIRQVLVEGSRFVLQENGEDVAAIIPRREFERLDSLKAELAPGPYLPDEEEYYEDEKGIHCLRPDLIQENFEGILEAVSLDGELFGLLPIENLGGKKVDTFMPVAVMMGIENFWVPEYIMAAKKEYVR